MGCILRFLSLIRVIITGVELTCHYFLFFPVLQGCAARHGALQSRRWKRGLIETSHFITSNGYVLDVCLHVDVNEKGCLKFGLGMAGVVSYRLAFFLIISPATIAVRESDRRSSDDGCLVCSPLSDPR